MSALEGKVPPPVLVVLAAATIWLLPRAFEPPGILSQAGLALVVAGLAINGWPKVLFRRAGTSVRPVRPSLASVLVMHGPYRFSRNPMYLGYAVALLGWSAWLAQPWGLVVVAFFVAYITRFQVIPEERHLSCRFRAQYAAYRRAVRRWA
ncbi:isoprenylcysteine carboxylmethyltransferase family protein [Arenimonas sp.]|uniref:methyltransferase family protein n=1 Tax=Arenimonas sp. TaxID=1872635 RepID=UPI002E35C746|nr:isoprenylcysteine carboxylmethyltransferase family protein [Arenimonas sp.]HEX4854249.1 isoprenylcysteine carboxylmethyltransferase family protein [Arenimonas sp.]